MLSIPREGEIEKERNHFPIYIAKLIRINKHNNNLFQHDLCPYMLVKINVGSFYYWFDKNHQRQKKIYLASYVSPLKSFDFFMRLDLT